MEDWGRWCAVFTPGHCSQGVIIQHRCILELSQCWVLQMYCIVIWASEQSAVCRKQLQFVGFNSYIFSVHDLSWKVLKLWFQGTVPSHQPFPLCLPYTLLPSSFTPPPATSCSQTPQFSFTGASQTSKEYPTPSRREKHTTEVTDWNSQCEQFQSFACCFWPPGSWACCGGRVWLADVSLCSETAEVFSGVLSSGRALIVW